MVGEKLEQHGMGHLAVEYHYAFNTRFERKEYIEGYVIEAAAREMLKDPKVKAELDERLKDPEFKKSPEQRLDFFYKKHPSFDARFGVYPVYRLDTPLPK